MFSFFHNERQFIGAFANEELRRSIPLDNMMLETAEKTIRKFNMLRINDRVIVAVSGGCDSVALVYLLNRLKKKYRLFLHLAHLNHMIRKEEADNDMLFVERLAKKLKLGLSCAKADVDGFAGQKKLSLEEAARKVRYDFLLSVAKENSAGKIALGHNRDDQAETVLMRFLRGSGIAGLRGIPPKRKSGTCLIVRPLLEVNRSQILKFLSAKDIPYCTDSTNSESLYFRNRVRNKLLPSLEKDFNPNIKEMLVNFAENVSEDFDYLEKASLRGLRAVRSKSNPVEVAIDVRKFFALHKALQKLVVRSTIKELKGDVRRIDYRHWKELEDLAQNRPGGSIVDLPGGISVIKKVAKLVFYKRNGR